MKTTERREKIIDILIKTEKPITASQIAKEYNVSRQVIVSDIAILRASGNDIVATPRGYLLESKDIKGNIIKKIAVRHNKIQLQKEIYTIVDNGGAILDVIVEHPIYGQLTGPLHIYSRYDADEFIKKILDSNTQPLSSLTDGIHLHTISCNSISIFNRIINELKKNSILLP